MLCFTLPQMLLRWLVHSRFCSALIIAPEFFFDMKDSVAGHYFVATSLHLENSFGGQVFSLFSTAEGPSLSTLAWSPQAALSALL